MAAESTGSPSFSACLPFAGTEHFDQRYQFSGTIGQISSSGNMDAFFLQAFLHLQYSFGSMSRLQLDRPAFFFVSG